MKQNEWHFSQLSEQYMKFHVLAKAHTAHPDNLRFGVSLSESEHASLNRSGGIVLRRNKRWILEEF